MTSFVSAILCCPLKTYCICQWDDILIFFFRWAPFCPSHWSNRRWLFRITIRYFIFNLYLRYPPKMARYRVTWCFDIQTKRWADDVGASLSGGRLPGPYCTTCTGPRIPNLPLMLPTHAINFINVFFARCFRTNVLFGSFSSYVLALAPKFVRKTRA